jgi:hypothetical protein
MQSQAYDTIPATKTDPTLTMPMAIWPKMAINLVLGHHLTCPRNSPKAKTAQPSPTVLIAVVTQLGGIARHAWYIFWVATEVLVIRVALKL